MQSWFFELEGCPGMKVAIASNELEALRDIIFYEPNTQGIKLYTYAAWARGAKK